jgi:sugar lactone lactonase YvrE
MRYAKVFLTAALAVFAISISANSVHASATSADPNFSLTLLAGGLSGPDNGLVYRPGTNDLLVSEFTANRISKIDATTGVVSLFTSVSSPDEMAVNSKGEVFVKTHPGGPISRFDSSGNFIGSFAPFADDPSGLAFDSSDNLYVAGIGTGVIWKFAAGTFDSPSVYASGFSSLEGIAFSPTGQMFAADYLSGSVYAVTPGGTMLTNHVLWAAGLASPLNFAFDPVSGDVFASNSDTIVRMSAPGRVTTFASGFTPGFANGTYSLDFDRAGNLYADDFSAGQVWKFSPTGCRNAYMAGGDSIPFGADLTSGLNYPAHLLNDHLVKLNSNWCLKNSAQSGASTPDYICGGPTVGCIVAGSDEPEGSSENEDAPQLSPTLKSNPDLITITLGVDNKVLPTMTATCIPDLLAGNSDGAERCESGILSDKAAWSGLSSDFAQVLAAYQQLMASRPNLVVAVTNYYDPMPTNVRDDAVKDFCTQLGFLAKTFRNAEGQCRSALDQFRPTLKKMDDIIVKLNSTLKAAATPFVKSSGGRLVFVNIHDAFAGHCSAINLGIDAGLLGGSAHGNLGCSSSWVVQAPSGSGTTQQNGYKLIYSGIGVHPNDAGHSCISNLIWEAVKAKLGSSEAPNTKPCG